MGTLFVDKLDPQSGTSLEIGSSGDTITIPSGCTITNNGTQTGFGGTNTPAFHVYKSGNQTVSNNTATNLTWESEFYDTDSAFASNKFTVPSGKGGTYVFFYLLKGGSQPDSTYIQAWLQKNGSDLDSQLSRSKDYISTANEIHLTGHYTDVASAGDYYEIRVFQNSGGSLDFLSEGCSFWGYKLIT